MSASPRKLHSESIPQLSTEESHVRHLQPAPPSTGVGCITRDSFAVAIDSARNPNAAAIEAQALMLAQKFGLVTPQNRNRFAAFNSIVGYTYPTADIERGLANAQWSNWLFFFDDMHDEDLERCRDIARVERSMDHYLDLLLNGGFSRAKTPLDDLTVDLHERLRAFGGDEWLKRFCASAASYLKLGVLKAVANWARNSMPNLDGYLIQREHDSSMHACIDMIEIAEGIRISDEVRELPAMSRARRACATTVAYFNDIVSYPKEVLIARNPNNLIHVLISDQKLNLYQAILFAVDVVNQCTMDLLTAEEELKQIPSANTPEVEAYLRGMKHWQRGNIEWSLEGERYASPWSPIAELVRDHSSGRR
ncbi:MAG: hypothetical protein IPK82_32050 [Polyangiaceae bacterium]|nr:hypothetical protein [Polyangiaceae bacterium]